MADTSDRNPVPGPGRRRRVLRWSLTLAVPVLLALWALAGFLLVPWVAKRELPRLVEEQTQHRLQIGEIRFNPFTLVLRASKVKLDDKAGKVVLGFDAASIDLEWASLPRRAWVLAEVSLLDPVVNIVVGRDGQLNLALLAPPAAAAKTNTANAAPTATAANAGPPRFDIAHVVVENGRIDFEDQREAYRNRLEKLSFELHSLSTLDADPGQYTLAARTPAGATLRWKGELALAPLAASGTLNIANAALAELTPYLDNVASARIAAGSAELDLPYRVALSGGKPQFTLTGAKLDVRGLELVKTGETAPFMKFGRLGVEGVDADSAARRVAVKTLRIADATVSARRDASGDIDLARIFAGRAGATSGETVKAAGAAQSAERAAQTSSWQGAIATIDINNVNANYLDATAKPPLQAAVKGVNGTLALAMDSAAAGAVNQPRLTLTGASLSASSVEMVNRDGAGSFIKLGHVGAEGIDADLSARRFAMQALRIGDGSVSAHRNADGNVDLAGLLTPGTPPVAGRDPAPGAVKASAGSEVASNTASAKTRGAASARKAVVESPLPWQASIGAIEIGNFNADYADATAKTPLQASLQGLTAVLKLDLRSGTNGVHAQLDAINVSARSLALGEAVKIADVAVKGARFDSGDPSTPKGPASALDIESVRVGGASVDAALTDGRLSLLDLIPAGGKDRSGPPMTVRLKALELANGSVNLADRGSGIAVALERVTAKLSDVSSDTAKPFGFELTAALKSGGTAAMRGRVIPGRGVVEAKVEASAVALSPLAPLFSRFASVKLASGEAALSGALNVGGKDAKIVYAGKAAISNVALNDAAGTKLVGWKSLSADSLRWSQSPDRLEIDEIRLNAPDGRFAIAKDGTSNISRAFAGKGVAPQTKADLPATAAVTAPTDSGATGTAPGAMEVNVRRVRVDQGVLEFSDDSVSPGFVARIVELTGTANALSSDRSTRSQFSFDGRVDEFGFARVSGSINAFAPRDRTTFRVQMRNIDLAKVSPYSMRFAGYRIATGKMGLDLNYRVRGSVIEGENQFTLEQFTFGEKVDSPDALDVPFELAIALLKDADGKIVLDLPVNGNLDDPQFSFAPLIWKAMGNLLGNIISAPFRALGRLFGGGESGEEAGVVAFDAGASRLLPPEKEKMAQLAGVLAKRPELMVVVPAHADANADGRALRRADLAREVARRAGFAVGDDEAAGQINTDDRRTRAALRALYTERFSAADLAKRVAEAEAKEKEKQQNREADAAKPLGVLDRARNLVSGEPQLADARAFYNDLSRRLRDSQPLAVNELANLGKARAAAIAQALRGAGVAEGRIVVKASPSSDGAGSAAVTGSATARNTDPDARFVKVQLSLAGH